MRRKRLRHIEQKRISRECWSLDYAFIVWLYPRLKTYLKDASKQVDLNYYKFTLNGVEKTQREVIERMIELCEPLYYNYYGWEELEKYTSSVEELLSWWKLVFNAMWW